MSNSLEFMKTRMYLPGYMSVKTLDYRGDHLDFSFVPVEPQVTILSSQYLTPRGMHICISQAVYAFAEELAERGRLGLDVKELRDVYLKGRLKLVEMLHRMRRELETTSTLPGRLNLTKFRQGSMPVIKMDFDIGDNALCGYLVGVIAPRKVSQTNKDILRMN